MDTFYEGPEKLLELWFSESNNDNGNGDLRDIPRSTWDQVLKLVNCTIISAIRNSDIDAYVLSESSMFITKRRFILKTCGQTTLLMAIEEIIALAKKVCGFDIVEDCFYSRKNFARPKMQTGPHQSFSTEVAVLDKLFPDGAAYTMGRLNRDCWHLYTVTSPRGSVHLSEPDQTLEILMTGLDPASMEKFFRSDSVDGCDATTKAGIDKIFPSALIDDFLFDPCGYSMNGILPGGEYFTIHITPETEFSYVSFETNVSQTCYNKLIRMVLDIFKPREFLTTVFANEASLARDHHKSSIESWRSVANYRRTELQLCVLNNYFVTYMHFARPDS